MATIQINQEALEALKRHEKYGQSFSKTIERLAVEVEKLRNGLDYINDFAQAHHGDQEPNYWLHALTVDIPELVKNTKAGFDD